MSKETELWRALQNESNIAEALERDREAEMQVEMKRYHTVLGGGYTFGVNRSVAPAVRATSRRPMPRVEGYETSDLDDSLILTCSTDPDCGVTHRVVMPGQMVRVIKGARPERAMQLADECGSLRTENTALLVENARLRRRIEDMERKGKR